VNITADHSKRLPTDRLACVEDIAIAIITAGRDKRIIDRGTTALVAVDTYGQWYLVGETKKEWMRHYLDWNIREDGTIEVKFAGLCTPY